MPRDTCSAAAEAAPGAAGAVAWEPAVEAWAAADAGLVAAVWAAADAGLVAAVWGATAGVADAASRSPEDERARCQRGKGVTR